MESYFCARTGPDFMHPMYTRCLLRCLPSVVPRAPIIKDCVSRISEDMTLYARLGNKTLKEQGQHEPIMLTYVKRDSCRR